MDEAMAKIFEIAKSISNPLSLAGFLSAALFFIFRQILAQNMKFAKVIIDRIFVLAFVAMILGFISYIWVNTNFLPRPLVKSVQCYAGIVGVLDDGKEISTNEYKLRILVNKTLVFNESVKNYFPKGHREPPLNQSFDNWKPLPAKDPVTIKMGDPVSFEVSLSDTEQGSFVAILKIYLTCGTSEPYFERVKENDPNVKYGPEGSSVGILGPDRQIRRTLQPN
jgi:hypothetical protein